MRVFAIGDLHLCGGADKPMEVFGENWGNHFSRISDNWQSMVKTGDIVLIPGDISWAMRLEDALPDILAIGALSGKKVLLRGNHDFWWSSLNKLRAALPKDMYAIQNDALCLNGVRFSGSRGWICPGGSAFDKDSDTKIYERELQRLELSLKAAANAGNGPLIGMLHYPPFNEKRAPSGFTELMERYGAERVIYGHLHAKACKHAFEGIRGGINYTLCSADHLEFAPRLIAEY